MKFKIFDVSKEHDVFFRLEQCYGTVQLIACDSEGNMLPDSSILSIQTDGSIRTYDSVSNNLGLKLDCDGRVIINND